VLTAHHLPQSLYDHLPVARLYALTHRSQLCAKHTQLALRLLQDVIAPKDRQRFSYRLAEVYRLSAQPERAKTLAEPAVEWFVHVPEDGEDLVDTAEARLVLGKILVDLREYQRALAYLEPAASAFEQGRHYLLGEACLYIGKSYRGLGGQMFRQQAREWATRAIAEFQRLELSHRLPEAQAELSAG